jgi:anti-sigma-K factor RskA
VSTSHDLYLDLVAAHAIGALDPEDRRALEEHLARGCDACEALLRDLAAPIEALARSAPPARPPRGLKARVMVAVGALRAAPGARRAPSGEPAARGALPAWAWGVASALIVAASLGWWRASSLSARVEDLEAEVARRAPAVLPDAELARFLAAHPQARSFTLEPTAQGETHRRARGAYDAASRRAIVVFEDFRAPPGEDFELWTVRADKTVSEGLVRVDASGRGVAVIENTGDPAALGAFAVSREAAGGSKDRRTPAQVVYLAPMS